MQVRLCKINILWVFKFGEVGGSATLETNRISGGASSETGSREQFAQKPIKPLRGPAPGAALFWQRIFMVFRFQHFFSCIGYVTKFSRKVPYYALIPLSLVFGGAKIFTKMLIRNFTKPKKPLKPHAKFHEILL